MPCFDNFSSHLIYLLLLELAGAGLLTRPRSVGGCGCILRLTVQSVRSRHLVAVVVVFDHCVQDRAFRHSRACHPRLHVRTIHSNVRLRALRRLRGVTLAYLQALLEEQIGLPIEAPLELSTLESLESSLLCARRHVLVARLLIVPDGQKLTWKYILHW